MHRQRPQLHEPHQSGKQPSTATAASAGNAAVARGDANAATASGRTKTCMGSGISAQCPQCSHRFRLIDCLLAAATATALPSSAASFAPEQDPKSAQQCSEDYQQQATISDAACSGGLIDKNLSSTGSVSPPTKSDPRSQSPVPSCRDASTAFEPLSQELLLTSEVSRTYQIVNTTIEQLERVIMDRTDRRIRKVSATCGCSIDLRSELPSGRFGVAKNFCVIRSKSEASADSCRCMLARQMGWNLVAKPN